MDMPTMTNALCLFLVICSVLIVAYDHKKWTQSNYRYGLMYFAWVPILTIDCMAVFSIGGDSVIAAIWLIVMPAILMAGGFTYRAFRRKEHTGTDNPNSARLTTSLSLPRTLKTSH